MVSFLSSWAQGIIIAVIIATIIELILPQGKLKKYIKVVIGMYIMFTVISPIISKFSNAKSLELDNILDTSNYQTEIEESSNTINQKLESNSSRTIKDIYNENLKSDIKAKLKTKGFETNSIYVKTNDDEDYSIIEIDLSIEKSNNKNNTTINSINIKINDIEITNETSNNSSSNISDSDKNEIKKYLADEYSIDEDVISID